MERKYNIGIITGSLFNGGAERVASVLANQLSHDGHNIKLFYFEKNKDDYFISKSIEKFLIQNSGSFLSKIIKDLRDFVKLSKNEGTCDVYFSFGIYTNWISCLSKVFSNNKVVISERNSPNNVDIKKITKLLNSALYSFADFCVFQTDEAKKYYNRSLQKKSKIISNPLTKDLPYKEDDDVPEIVAIGRLFKQKNHTFLIESFRKFSILNPEYRLRIFGEGDERKKLELLIEFYKLNEKVILEGYCNNIHERILKSRIFVLTSDYEGIPNALMEMMAMGFPVISSDCPCGGPMSLIKNGYNGLLYQCGKDDEFLNLLNKIANEKSLRISLGENAKTIRKTNNAESISKEWLCCIKMINRKDSHDS